MTAIRGTKSNDALTGHTGSDTILGLSGNDVITGNDPVHEELLVDGSFETAHQNPGTWGNHTSVGGWHTDSVIEVWGKNFQGKPASNGDKYIELDSDSRFSRVWQDVHTVAGETYDFSFDFAARKNTALATNTIEVYWNDILVGTFDPTSTAWRHGGLSLTGTGGLDRIEFREQAGDNNSLGGLIDNASLTRSASGHDVIAGGAGNDTLSGGGGDDLIYGSSAPTLTAHTHTGTVADDDTIYGGAGRDTIFGNSGQDQIFGDTGNDRLHGGRGDDLVSGGNGDDRLFGNSGNDHLLDGSGNDVVFGNSGNDTVIVGAGNDQYFGGSGFDILDFYSATNGVKVDLSKHVATGMGHDSVYGFEQVVGSNFDDMLKGSKHGDVLVGAGGNDIIRGGDGSDVLTGGAGNDTFVWRLSDLSKHQSSGAIDHITDFSTGDRLDLRDAAAAAGVTQLADIADLMTVYDDGVNSHVFVKFGTSFTEIAVLDGITGMTAVDLAAEGAIVI